MMRSIRRSWWAAALMVFLSPAGLGAVVPLLHICGSLHHRIEAAAGDHQHHGDPGSHHAGVQAGQTEEAADPAGQCTCIGACHNGITLVPSLSCDRLVVETVAEQPSPVRPCAEPPPPSLPLDHLPPPTAPPAV